jgi:pectate lyase
MQKRFRGTVSLVLTLLLGGSRLLVTRAQTALPAFPGAEGAGAYASGGRGGAVYHVTNLNTSGPGSLADAVSRPNRFIVFDISGAIDLSSGQDGKRGKLLIAEPNMTIAGQTAPGEGIALKGGALEITASNVVVRHLRIRRGFNFIGDSGDAINIKGHMENVIVDHVSTAWATDENLTLTNANKVTAQYAIAAEGLDYFNPRQTPARHSEGSLFGSSTPGGRMTIHHSIYAHNRLRNPRTTAGGDPPPMLDFRNNIVYDAKEYTSHTGSQAVHLNLVNNYYKDGPSTGIEGSDIRGIIFTFMNTELNRLYAAGNYIFGNEASTADNWRAVRRRITTGPALEAMRAREPFPTPPVTTQSALQAFQIVLEEAGAILPARDAIDLRIINDIRHGTGAVINFETDVPMGGRWQTYRSLPAPKDSDGDGIPDYWEEQFGLNKNSAADAMQDRDGDGYTNIEEYVNNTDPTGGNLPIVYISASHSRAYRQDGEPGEFRIMRTGGKERALEVRYSIGGTARAGLDYYPLPGSVTIPAGAAWTAVAVKPLKQSAGSGSKLVVAAIEPRTAYHIGCPRSALAVIEPGATPPPVNLSGLDPAGGETAAARKKFDDLQEAHKEKKKSKRERKKGSPERQE